MTEHTRMVFVVAVLYSVEEKWRGVGSSASFEDIVTDRKGVSLHRGFLHLHREGLLADFFGDFYFDPLFGTSNLIDVVSEAAVSYHFIRIGGTDFAYHVDDASPHVIHRLLDTENIPIEFIEKVSKRLNELLDEQERSAKSLPSP